MRLPRGFTLVELLVVISVIGILFGLGIAGYRAFSENQVLDNAYKELRTQVNLARQLALSGEKPQTCITNNKDLLGYVVNIDSSGGVVQIKASCKDISLIDRSSYSLPTGVQVTNWPGNVTFKVLGQGIDLSGDATGITITDSNSGRSITNIILRRSGILEK